MVQEAPVQMRIQARVKMGGVEPRSAPHPFDRLLSGTARMAKRKGQASQRAHSTHSPDSRSQNNSIPIQFLYLQLNQLILKLAPHQLMPQTISSALWSYAGCIICLSLSFCFCYKPNSKPWDWECNTSSYYGRSINHYSTSLQSTCASSTT